VSPRERRELSPLFTWRGAVASRHSGLPPVSRHVALTLSLHMSEKGDSAFPGDELLGEETDLSRGTIRTHRHLLVERGWLVLVEQGGGRGRANKYQATIPSAYWDGIDTDERGQEATGLESLLPQESGQDETGCVVTPLPETGHLTTLNRSSDDAKPVSRRPPGRKESVIEDGTRHASRLTAVAPLLELYISECRRHHYSPTERWCKQLVGQVIGLLDEKDLELIQSAIRAIADEHKQPGVLAHVVVDLESARGGSRGKTA
jgi:hypothetical protein